MEHESQRRGVYIDHKMCCHGGKGCLQAIECIVFARKQTDWLTGCPDCFQNGRKEVVAFEKTKQGKRKLTREMQYARTLKKKEFLRRVLNGSSVRSTTSIKGRFI